MTGLPYSIEWMEETDRKILAAMLKQPRTPSRFYKENIMKPDDVSRKIFEELAELRAKRDARLREAPICNDCRWAKYDDAVFALKPFCSNPKAFVQPERSLVTGDIDEPRAVGCETARYDMDLCGQEGRHWEAKEIGFGT